VRGRWRGRTLFGGVFMVCLVWVCMLMFIFGGCCVTAFATLTVFSRDAQNLKTARHRDSEDYCSSNAYVDRK
jgi:hypothetical protein